MDGWMDVWTNDRIRKKNESYCRQTYISWFFSREYHLKYEELVIPGRNVSDILEIVFKNYDKRIRPFYGGKCIS